MGKSKVSAMVSRAGMVADVWTRLDQAVRAQGGNEEDLHLLARDEGQAMIDQIAGLLVKASAAARNVYPVIVTDGHGDDYSKLFASLLVVGDYRYKNPNITSANYSGEYISGFDAILVHLNRDISSDDAVKELDQLDMRPATMIELLAFGARFPEIQREFPVVALGQSWVDPDSRRCVGYLNFWRDRRRVDLGYWTYDWGAFCRFLGVRKST